MEEKEILHTALDNLDPALLKGDCQNNRRCVRQYPKSNGRVTGEPAGDLLTNYLRPEKLTIYTSETKKDLMMHYGLVPDQNGNIQVYEKFWEQDDQRDIAPDLLVYADLVNTRDKRCIETATMIYNEHIKPEL